MEQNRIQIQHLLKLNDGKASINEPVILIQIQHLLKLNKDLDDFKTIQDNSNTTLVKVKLVCLAQAYTSCSYSNTTLVKVKLVTLHTIHLLFFHSNTTLVKVKCQ